MQIIRLPWLLKSLQSIDFPHKLGICERLFGRQLAKYGQCWVQTSADITWKLDLRNPTLRWIVYGKYEGAGFLNWAEKYLPKGGIIVDSGANIGQVLLYTAQWVKNGKVLAFEPNAVSANWLEECLALNKELPVELIRSGLSNKSEQLLLKDNADTSKIGSQSFISTESGNPITVVRLEEVLAQRNIAEVDLWKLDVEGHEIPALMGAASLLQEKKIKAVYAEIRGENGLRIRDYLKDFGYDYFDINDKGDVFQPDKYPDEANLLFLPQ